MNDSNDEAKQEGSEPKVPFAPVSEDVSTEPRGRLCKRITAILGALAGLAVGFYFVFFTSSESIPAPIGMVTALFGWLVCACLGMDSEAAAFVAVIVILPMVCVALGAVTGYAIGALASMVRGRFRQAQE